MAFADSVFFLPFFQEMQMFLCCWLSEKSCIFAAGKTPLAAETETI